MKSQKVAITRLAIGIDSQVTHHVVATEKVTITRLAIGIDSQFTHHVVATEKVAE